MLKAKITKDFTTCQVFEDDTLDCLAKFKEGMEVEVLKKVEGHTSGPHFVIYSPELNEATVVYEKMLDFGF